MLNQKTFEQQHKQTWAELDECLTALEATRLFRKRKTDSAHHLPTLYANLCQHHAIALSRGYSHTLVDTLHAQINRAHHQLYRYQGNWLARTMRFIGGGFAAAVRKEAKLFGIACLLFFGTALVAGSFAAYSEDIAELILGGRTKFNIEQMYEPNTFDIRPANMEDASSFYMFGFYIANNIGIDFRVFASGIVFGIGSVFFLLLNGVSIGAAAGHLSAIGYVDTFWGFVAGHSAPELLALCISGTAGLMLGRALISPGQQSRALALLRNAQAAVPLVLGAGLMTLVAAFIEAYWSPLEFALPIKVAVGLLIWVVFGAYLLFAGRAK